MSPHSEGCDAHELGVACISWVVLCGATVLFKSLAVVPFPLVEPAEVEGGSRGSSGLRARRHYVHNH
jgi:hypothetical protein